MTSPAPSSAAPASPLRCSILLFSRVLIPATEGTLRISFYRFSLGSHSLGCARRFAGQTVSSDSQRVCVSLLLLALIDCWPLPFFPGRNLETSPYFEIASLAVLSGAKSF